MYEILSKARNVTFWGFDGSTSSHGSGFLVLFKLKTVNKNTDKHYFSCDWQTGVRRKYENKRVQFKAL